MFNCLSAVSLHAITYVYVQCACVHVLGLISFSFVVDYSMIHIPDPSKILGMIYTCVIIIPVPVLHTHVYIDGNRDLWRTYGRG